jgi:hypothetical protein
MFSAIEAAEARGRAAGIEEAQRWLSPNHTLLANDMVHALANPAPQEPTP